MEGCGYYSTNYAASQITFHFNTRHYNESGEKSVYVESKVEDNRRELDKQVAACFSTAAD